jgi:hypothetical protein
VLGYSLLSLVNATEQTITRAGVPAPKGEKFEDSEGVNVD